MLVFEFVCKVYACLTILCVQEGVFLIKVKEAIIVEGKYDKIKLSNFIDGLIIDVDGFGLFKNKEKIEMIRKVANKDGVIVLTDSDSAGFIIRNYLNKKAQAYPS